ncbi:MAG: DHA2 family efflux MFS transporter permease subunit [Phycicoccus sp.]
MTDSAADSPTTRQRVEPLDRSLLAVVGVLVSGSLMVVLDTTILSVAIGQLAGEFTAPLPRVQWTVTGYTLALSAAIPITAWAVARWGSRPVYLAAVAMFVACSGLAGAAWSLESLVAFRVLQGVGGGLLTPVAMTVVLRTAPAAQRGRAMALLGLPVLIGAVSGPALGGWLLDTASWRWIFWVNVPIGLLTLTLGARVLPADTGSRPQRLDRTGLLLLSPGLAALLYGLTRWGETGESDLRGVLPVIAGAVMVAAFVLRASRRPDPLVTVALLRRRDLAAGAGILLTFSAAYFGSAILIPLYFQLGRGESATTSGLLLIPQAVATGLSMQVAGRLIDRISPARVVIVGIALAVGGFGLFAALIGPDTSYVALTAALALAGIGVGATLMPTITTATRNLSHDDTPSGTTLLNIVSQVATAVGATTISVLLTARFIVTLPTPLSDVAALNRATPAERTTLAEPLATAFQTTLALPVGLLILALIVAAAFLPRAARHDQARPAGRDDRSAGPPGHRPIAEQLRGD